MAHLYIGEVALPPHGRRGLKGFYLLPWERKTFFLLCKVRRQLVALRPGVPRLLKQKILPGGKRLPDGVMPVEEWPMQFLHHPAMVWYAPAAQLAAKPTLWVPDGRLDLRVA